MTTPDSGGAESPTAFSFEDCVDRLIPRLIPLGLSYDEFYRASADKIRAYRTAEKNMSRQANQEAWRAGLYVYHAIGAMVPVLRPLSKATEPRPYLDRPFPMTRAEVEEREKEKMMSFAENFRLAVEAQQRRGETDG